ncbi:MAG: heme-binding protein, partial [Pirellulales bacterium]
SNRFTRKEMLEAIVHPSQVISSQYVTKVLILEDGRQVSGIVAPGAKGELVVTQSSGERIMVAEVDVVEQKPSKVSTMPAGLLETLSLEEISDLFAYMGKGPQQLAEKPQSDKAEKR